MKAAYYRLTDRMIAVLVKLYNSDGHTTELKGRESVSAEALARRDLVTVYKRKRKKYGWWYHKYALNAAGRRVAEEVMSVDLPTAPNSIEGDGDE